VKSALRLRLFEAPYSVRTSPSFRSLWNIKETLNCAYLAFSAGNSSETTHAISVIIVCRMMLDVMEAAKSRVTSGEEIEVSVDRTESGHDVSTLHFTSHVQYSVARNNQRARSVQWASESATESGASWRVWETVDPGTGSNNGY